MLSRVDKSATQPVGHRLLFLLLLFAAIAIQPVFTNTQASSSLVKGTKTDDNNLTDNKEPVLASVPALPNDATHILDVRKKAQCGKRSIQSAICLPIEHILADNRRLANFSGLFWVLGTLGLTGSETVYVIGDSEKRKQFIAGWLFVSGQHRVRIVTADVKATIKQAAAHDLSIGTPSHPSSTRINVFKAMPRTNRILTNSEVVTALQATPIATLLDGRSEAEYWGRRIQAARGGHLPGAIWLSNPDKAPDFSANNVIAYAHDSVDGLMLLAQLTMSQVDIKLYLGGWVDWANRHDLPVDAESFPVSRQRGAVND